MIALEAAKVVGILTMAAISVGGFIASYLLAKQDNGNWGWFLIGGCFAAGALLEAVGAK